MNRETFRRAAENFWLWIIVILSVFAALFIAAMIFNVLQSK